MTANSLPSDQYVLVTAFKFPGAFGTLAVRTGASTSSPSGTSARHPSRPLESKAMTIDDLIQQIEQTEHLIVVYRNANEVIVGTEDQIYSRRGLINRTVLTAAEIGDTIVNILERRLAAMQAELENSGPKTTGQADDLLPSGCGR